MIKNRHMLTWFFGLPLDEMPLYINCENNLDLTISRTISNMVTIIAKWRLQIGK